MPKQLLKLLMDNRGERKPLVAQVSDDEETLYIYDAIVSTAVEADWFGGVSAQELVPLIRQSKSPKLALRINSGGGDVFAAQAIAQAIRDFEGDVTVYVDGTCASAATVIACAADKIVMASGGLWMVHRVWTMAMGNTNDFLEMADLLDKADGLIAQAYAAKTGANADAMLGLMDAETWMTAEEALSAKFIDEVSPVIKAQVNKWNLSAYANAPEPKAEPTPEPKPTADEVSSERQQFLSRRTRIINAQANH
ncbi:MAG: Clp protease ClpP [Rhodocyclaceae bacterium]|nr:Clp protease ClpP [Rhodocyclaceae bacterium]